MFKKSYLTLFILIVMYVNKSLFATEEKVPNIDDLINNISKHEIIIQNISAKLEVTIPETGDKFIEGEWGYSKGREYIKGTINLYLDYVSKKVEHPFQYAFDGQIMYIYRYDPLANIHTGRITSLEPANFVGYPTLNTLLGHDVHSSGRLSVTEALNQAKDVYVQPKMEEINGHKCYVVDAIEIQKPVIPGDNPVDVRLYIDPERDYRILRLERYTSLPEPLRWKELTRRIDNIKLQQINGTWIPIEGEFHNYSPQEVPISGYTIEDIEKMKPEEAVYKIQYKIEPLVPMRLIKIDPESVSFGEDIPEDKFKIQWPQGTTIWDDFTQLGYRISEPIIANTQLNELHSESKSIDFESSEKENGNLTKEEHKEIVKNGKNDIGKSVILSTKEENTIISSKNYSFKFLLLLLPVTAVFCTGVIILVLKIKKNRVGIK